MTDETPMFICDWCGKEFPADARTMVESGISAQHLEPDWEELPSYEEATPELIFALTKELEITEAQAKTLLETGHVGTGASCVCIECQGD